MGGSSSSYIWPSGDKGFGNQSVSLTALVSGLAWPNIHSASNAYYFTNAASVPTALSLQTPPKHMNAAFCAAFSDANGDAWLVGYGEAAYLVSSGLGVALQYPYPVSGTFFAGGGEVGGHPYFVDIDGQVYTVSGSAIAAISGTFGHAVNSASAYGSTLYASLVTTPPALGLMTFSNPQTGSATIENADDTQVTAFNSISPSASGVALSGYFSPSQLVTSGYAATFIAPELGGVTSAVVVYGANNAFQLLSYADNVWTQGPAITASGAPVAAQWVSSNEQVAISDAANDSVSIFDFVSGHLNFFQQVSVVGASAMATTPDSQQLLVCCPDNNVVEVLLNDGLNNWSISQTVTGVADPQCVALFSQTSAVVGAQNSLYFMDYNSNLWRVSSIKTLTFTPSGVAIDPSGNAYACGNNGELALVTSADGVVSSLTWSGGGLNPIWNQGQILVSDITNQEIRLFTNINQTLVSSGTYAISDLAWDNFIGSYLTVSLSTGGLYFYRFTGPFSLAPERSGVISSYVSSSFAYANTGVGNDVMGITWDVSGNIWASTIQNNVYEYTSDLTLETTTTLPAYDGSVSGVVMGSAYLRWFTDGHLYSANSMNSALIQVE